MDIIEDFKKTLLKFQKENNILDLLKSKSIFIDLEKFFIVDNINK